MSEITRSEATLEYLLDRYLAGEPILLVEADCHRVATAPKPPTPEPQCRNCFVYEHERNRLCPHGYCSRCVSNKRCQLCEFRASV